MDLVLEDSSLRDIRPNSGNNTITSIAFEINGYPIAKLVTTHMVLVYLACIKDTFHPLDLKVSKSLFLCYCHPNLLAF